MLQEFQDLTLALEVTEGDDDSHCVQTLGSLCATSCRLHTWLDMIVSVSNAAPWLVNISFILYDQV